jgi:hypothetical protein
MEMKELLLIGADRRRNGGRDDCSFQISRRLRRLGMAPNEELVVNIRRREGVERKTGVAPKIRSFR